MVAQFALTELVLGSSPSEVANLYSLWINGISHSCNQELDVQILARLPNLLEEKQYGITHITRNN